MSNLICPLLKQYCLIAVLTLDVVSSWDSLIAVKEDLQKTGQSRVLLHDADSAILEYVVDRVMQGVVTRHPSEQHS
jgi:hypothetical protein